MGDKPYRVEQELREAIEKEYDFYQSASTIEYIAKKYVTDEERDKFYDELISFIKAFKR